ncbi:MAG TPA: methionyl-tRNA formyltransferase [Chitinophagales bacterium]|nr:methionyl-tRNA formyltransferase [Chitinophagales bacterium]
MQSLRIVFFGTPEFAVPMLETLVTSTHQVVAVVTAPDKPAGRGMELHQSEVKLSAIKNQVKILQPEKLKNETFVQELQSLHADLFVIVAFRMLPEIVWNMPRLGTINLHASLLPNYRGAAPINWVIINGEKETGVSTFFLQHEIDTGNIIFQEKVKIESEETVGTLYKKLMQLGAKVLRKTVDAVAVGEYPETPQAHITEVKKAPKIFKPDCEIDFNKSAVELHNFVKGLSPYPAAFFKHKGKAIKVFSAAAEISNHQHAMADLVSDDKTYLKVACKDGFLNLLEVQLEGKKKMNIEEFLRGFSAN